MQFLNYVFKLEGFGVSVSGFLDFSVRARRTTARAYLLVLVNLN